MACDMQLRRKISMNWTALVKLEPKLIAVERFARSARRNGMNWVDFALRINQLLRPLLGSQATEPTLRSGRAGRVARKHLMSIWATSTSKDGRRADRQWDGDRLPWDVDDESEANHENTEAI